MIDSALRDAYEARRREVEVYERTWWLDQDDFTALHPERRAYALVRASNNQPVDSSGFYRDGDEWLDWRISIHKEVLDRLSGADLDSRGTPRTSLQGAEPAPSGPVYFLTGLPGSGKTTSLHPLALRHASVRGAAVSDADSVRAALPEYANGLGSQILQVETAYLTYDDAAPDGGRQRRVLTEGAPVAFVDVIGDATYLPRTVAQLHAKGRSAYILMTRCDPDVCIERVMRRAVDDGRFVDTSLVIAKIGVPEQALAAAQATGLLAGWAVVDTTSAAEVVDGQGMFDAP